MLQQMRDKTQGVAAKVITGFIIIMFGLWGVQNLIRGNNIVVVAKVNGDKVTEPELAHAIVIQKRQLLERMKDNVQPELLDDNVLRGPVLDSLINKRLVAQSAADLKLGVSDNVVVQTILSMPAFQENGKFSQTVYEAKLRNNDFNAVEFRQLLHDELVMNQLQSGFVDSEFVTPQEFKGVAGLLQQRRSFRYLTIPVATLAAKAEVSDADVAAYYQAHPDQFMREERVKLEYVDLRSAAFAKPVDDAALHAEYDRFKAAYKPVTERHAAHIMVQVNAQRTPEQAKALIATIAQKLATGADFGELAKQYSDDAGSKNSGGDLGFSAGDTFPPVFEDALAKLKVGEVSPPVQSQSGLHLIKLIEEQTKQAPSFDDKKAELTASLQQSSAQPDLQKAVEQLRDLVFNSDGLKQPADKLKLPVGESDWIDRKSTDPLLGNPKVIAAAFSSEVLKDHSNSDVLELAADHYLVLRVKEHDEAAPKPLDEVKSQIVAKVKQERGVEAGKALAAELIAKLSQGTDLQALATEHGFTAQVVDKSERNNPSVSPELVRAAFGIPRPTGEQPALTSIDLASGDIVVLQLQGVDPGAPEGFNPAQQRALNAQLRQSYGEAGFDAFMDSIKVRANITRH